MVIAEESLQSPYPPTKVASINKASVGRQVFFQKTLVQERQDVHHYARFLPELVFFLYAAGKNLVDITLKPFIVRSTCLATFDVNFTLCDTLAQHPDEEHIVQKRAALMLMVNQLLVYGPAVLQGVLWGDWSDRNGRKLPMMTPSLGITMAALFYVVSPFLPQHSLCLILMGSLFQGFFGKTAVFTMALYSYVSEITHERRRTAKFTSLTAFKYLGCFSGALLSGVIIQVSNIPCAFSAGVVLHMVCVITIYVYVIDDAGARERKNRLHARQGGRTCVDVLLSSGSVMSRRRTGRGRLAVWAIFITALLYQACQTGHQENLVLLVTRAPLGWTPSLYSFLVSFSDLTTGLSLIVVAPVMTHCCEARDTLVLALALLSVSLRALGVGLASSTWMVFIAVGVGAFGGIAISVLKSLASKLVELEEQGKTFALFAGTETVAKVIGSVFFTLLYSLTSDVFPGLLFLLMGVVTACLAPVAYSLNRCRPRRRMSVVEKFTEEITDDKGHNLKAASNSTSEKTIVMEY